MRLLPSKIVPVQWVVIHRRERCKHHWCIARRDMPGHGYMLQGIFVLLLSLLFIHIDRDLVQPEAIYSCHGRVTVSGYKLWAHHPQHPSLANRWWWQKGRYRWGMSRTRKSYPYSRSPSPVSTTASLSRELPSKTTWHIVRISLSLKRVHRVLNQIEDLLEHLSELGYKYWERGGGILYSITAIRISSSRYPGMYVFSYTSS